MTDIADPRHRPAEAEQAGAREAHRLARASLEAVTGQVAQALDHQLDALIDAELGAQDAAAGARLAAWLATAPTVAVHRHLWRALVRRSSRSEAEGLATTLFAIPLVIVAGVAGDATSRVVLSGVLPDTEALAKVMLEHGALAGNRTFSLAGALVAADTLDVAALPALLAARRRVLAEGAPVALAPAPLALPSGESVHLRFLVGSALAAPAVDVTRDETTGRWGRPLTQALAAQLASPGVTLLALPRPALTPLAAVAQGRTAQRDISAQLFASNAIRQLRASFGEPAAVLSAHRAPDAPGGGELRLSLSSTFSPRDAYGFRCPILPWERVEDAATMLLDLLRDARVGDVRVVAGVHDERDPVTGGPLLFKPDTIPPGSTVALH
jgi:hypothetical protein